MEVITRFAPSSTGHLHLGHAYSAWLGWQRARISGGNFLLRLEDIDSSRSKPEYMDSILEDLRWLGLNWDGDIRVQSDYLPEYRLALQKLNDRGVLYPCFCTRRKLPAPWTRRMAASRNIPAPAAISPWRSVPRAPPAAPTTPFA